MTKKEFKKGYPEGPVCAWKVDAQRNMTIYPGYVFCQAECMGAWIETNINPKEEGVSRGNMPYSCIKIKIPHCVQCKKPLWSK